MYVPEPNSIFELLARAEAMPVSLADYRDTLVLIKRASGLSTHGRMPEQYKEVCSAALSDAEFRQVACV